MSEQASHPLSSAELLRRGLEHHRAGRLLEALQDYEQVLPSQPDNAELLNLLGLLKHQLGQSQEASVLLARALSRQPDNPAIWHNLGQARTAQGQLDDALRCYRQVLALAPEQNVVRFQLGQTLAKLGRWLEAMEVLLEALSSAPDFHEAFSLLVTCLEEAIKHGMPVLDPESPLAPATGPAEDGRAGGMISVIVCSVDAAKFAAVCQNYQAHLAGEPHEIIGIHDAKSLCEGYNRGLRQSRGEVVVFSHDDIEILTPDFSQKLRRYLGQYDLIGVAGTDRLVAETWGAAGWPFLHGLVPQLDRRQGGYTVCAYDLCGPVKDDIQALDGLFLAARRPVAQSVGFDQARFDGFHLYDLDFSFSAYLAGFRLAVCNDITIAHHSGGLYDATWRKYADVFMDKHGPHMAHSPGMAVGCHTARLNDQAQARLFCQGMVQFMKRLGFN